MAERTGAAAGAEAGTEGGQCVEVAAGSAAVHVRDSKAEAGPILTVSREAWAGFIELTASERRV
ncbi:DUF397 domain-containing protein [Streptomyces albogriseolus]|uniref:DUF397 domain-containing protein n=1 Tax=Streptomyces albogriseolus TaxID=1887 RepID=UPI003D7448DF